MQYFTILFKFLIMHKFNSYVNWEIKQMKVDKTFVLINRKMTSGKPALVRSWHSLWSPNSTTYQILNVFGHDGFKILGAFDTKVIGE